MSTLKSDSILPVSGNTDLSLSGSGTGGVKVTDYLVQTKGSDIASATALVLGKDGNAFDVTGTTAITSIGTQGIGSHITLQFDGILTFTHHATDLILPGAANITTAAGDIAVMYEYASGDWRCTTYTKATGTAIIAAAGGASDAEKANIFVNAFRISVNGELTKQNMVDGIVDVYDDRTGINISASSNIKDVEFIDPTGTVSASDQWTRDTGNFDIAAAGHIDQTGTTVECENTTTMTGYWKMTFTYTAIGSGDHFIGIFDADDSPTNTNVLTNPDTDCDTFYFHDSSSPADFATGANQEASTALGTNLALTAGDDVILQLTQAGTVTWTVEGVLKRTHASTFATTRNWRFAWEGSTLNTTPEIDALTFFSNRSLTTGLQPSAGTNMVAVSETVTALAEPSDTFIVIQQEDVAAITLNTDLKAFVSRDAGSTWTQITLAEESNLATGRILTGSASISGQPSGTSMRYKIETLNTKDQKIHATGLQWS